MSVPFHPSHLEADYKLLQLDQLEGGQLSFKHNHLGQEDTAVKEAQNLLDIYSHGILDRPQMSAVQQWPHGIRYCSAVPRAFLRNVFR